MQFDDGAPAFDEVEASRLRELVREHGQQDWDTIASRLPGKTPRDCQAFWTGVVLSESTPALHHHHHQIESGTSQARHQSGSGSRPTQRRSGFDDIHIDSQDAEAAAAASYYTNLPDDSDDEDAGQLDPALSTTNDAPHAPEQTTPEPVASTSGTSSSAAAAKAPKKHWTKDEDALLLKFVEERGPKDWKIIATAIGPHRTGQSCCARYCRIAGGQLAPGKKELPELTADVSAKYASISKGKRERWQKWAPEDDEKLKEIVQEQGAYNWDDIAEKMGGTRTGNACHGRWNHLLSQKSVVLDKPVPRPAGVNAAQPRWTPEDDDKLRRLKDENPKASWAFIGDQMDPKRTAGSCRSRYGQHIQKGGAYAYYKKPKILAKRIAQAAAQQALEQGHVRDEDRPELPEAAQPKQIESTPGMASDPVQAPLPELTNEQTHEMAQEAVTAEGEQDQPTSVPASGSSPAAEQSPLAPEHVDESAQVAEQYTHVADDEGATEDADLAFARSIIDPLLMEQAIAGDNSVESSEYGIEQPTASTSNASTSVPAKKKRVPKKKRAQKDAAPAPGAEDAHSNQDGSETAGTDLDVTGVKTTQGRVWTPDEEKHLLELVDAHGRKQWAQVAEALGTGRSAASASARWQRLTSNGAVAPDLESLGQPRSRQKSRPWLPEDDAELRRLVEQYGKNAWELVANSMTRPRSQYGAMARWYDVVSKREVPERAAEREASSAFGEEALPTAADGIQGEGEERISGHGEPQGDMADEVSSAANIISNEELAASIALGTGAATVQPAVRSITRTAKKRWTKEEDAELVEVLVRLGDASWPAISRALSFDRPATSCRLRWANYLTHQSEYADVASQIEQARRRDHVPRASTGANDEADHGAGQDQLVAGPSARLEYDAYGHATDGHVNLHHPQLDVAHSADHLPPMPTSDIDLNAFLAHLSQAQTGDGSLPFLHGVSSHVEDLPHEQQQQSQQQQETAEASQYGHKRLHADTLDPSEPQNVDDDDRAGHEFINEEHHQDEHDQHVEKRHRVL